jgi:tetratricopeptide (TPR) repeat protein
MFDERAAATARRWQTTRNGRPPDRRKRRIWPVFVLGWTSCLTAPASTLLAQGAGPSPRLAVFQFEDRSEDDAHLWLRGGLQDLFTQEVAAAGRAQVVGTSETGPVLAEQDLARTGVIATPTPTDGYRLARPDVLLKGQYRVEGQRIRIDATLSDASSDVTLSQAIVEGDVADSCRLAGDLTTQLMANWGQPLDAGALAGLRALACPSFDLLMWLHEGLLYLETDDLPEAWYCFRRASEAEPQTWEPRSWLVYVLRRMGQFAEAEHELRQALPVVVAEEHDRQARWIPGQMRPGDNLYPQLYVGYAKSLADFVASQGTVAPEGPTVLNPAYCLLLAGMPFSQDKRFGDLDFNAATAAQMKLALEWTEHSFLASVHKSWLDRGLQQGDLEAAIGRWKAWQDHAAPVVAALRDRSLTSEDKQRYLQFYWGWYDEHHRMDAWELDRVRRVTQASQGLVLDLALQRGLDPLAKSFEQLKLPVFRLSAGTADLALPLGRSLLLAPEGRGIVSLTGSDLVGDPLHRPVDFEFAPLPPAQHAPPLRVSEDVSYHASLLQPALTVDVNQRAGQETVSESRVVVECMPLASAGRLAIRVGHAANRIQIGQHDVVATEGTSGSAQAPLLLVPATYDVRVVHGGVPALRVRIVKGRTTWLDIPRLLEDARPPDQSAREKAHAPTSRPGPAKQSPRAEAVADLGPSRHGPAKALSSGMFYSLQKVGKDFILAVSQDLVNWSDDLVLNTRVPIDGSLNDVQLFQDNAGRFVLTWYGSGGAGPRGMNRLWVATSVDLENWTSLTDMPGSAPYRLVQMGNGTFVLLYSGGWVTASTDLLQWSPPRHLCRHLFGQACPWDGEAGDGSVVSDVHLVLDERGVLHAFVCDAHTVYHPDQETGSLTEGFRHFFVAHFTSPDGQTWSDLQYLYSEKARDRDGPYSMSLLQGFAVARAAHGGLIGGLIVAEGGSRGGLVRTCPQAEGPWLLAYRDGRWFTTPERLGRFDRPLGELIYGPERNETRTSTRGGISRITDSLLATLTEPFALPSAKLEQYTWVEPAQDTGSTVMLAEPGPEDFVPLWPAIRAALIYYLNGHDGVVLKAQLDQPGVPPTLAGVRSNSYYASHDFVIFPALEQRGAAATLRATIVAPRTGQMVAPVVDEGAYQDLPARLGRFARSIRNAIGISPAPDAEPRLSARLFRDLPSMQFFVQVAQMLERADRWRIADSWYAHDPECPFVWDLVADEGRYSGQRSVPQETVQRDEELRRKAADLGYVPPYNMFTMRTSSMEYSSLPGVAQEPTDAQMLQALQRCPHAMDVRTFLVVTTGLAGQWDTADSLLRPAEQAEPDEWQWKKLRGLLLGWQGRYADAAAYWRACPRSAPNGRPNYVTIYHDVNRFQFWEDTWVPVEAMRGYDLVRAGQYAEAADVLDREARTYGIDHWAAGERGAARLTCAALYALCQAGQPQRAIDLYGDYAKKHEVRPEEKYHLARAYYLLGNRLKARRLLHEAEALAEEVYNWPKGQFIPEPIEIDRFRRELQHHRSVFGL